ncbi:hypothetical protein JST97_38625 [bacterium]|nr:hypothetical protein [bacterium]
MSDWHEQRRQALAAAKEQADLDGKEPFDDARFRAAYQQAAPYVPEGVELEMEYYLDHRTTRTLEEFIQGVKFRDLWSGGDMHLPGG